MREPQRKYKLKQDKMLKDETELRKGNKKKKTRTRTYKMREDAIKEINKYEMRREKELTE